MFLWIAHSPYLDCRACLKISIVSLGHDLGVKGWQFYYHRWALLPSFKQLCLRSTHSASLLLYPISTSSSFAVLFGCVCCLWWESSGTEPGLWDMAMQSHHSTSGNKLFWRVFGELCKKAFSTAEAWEMASCPSHSLGHGVGHTGIQWNWKLKS